MKYNVVFRIDSDDGVETFKENIDKVGNFIFNNYSTIPIYIRKEDGSYKTNPKNHREAVSVDWTTYKEVR